jgi:iterative type I PKS product template protein
MVIEDYVPAARYYTHPRNSHVVVTSAKSQASYHTNKRNLLEWLRANQDAKIEDIAYTTTARRIHHPIRFACTASTTQELIGKLELDTLEAVPSRTSPVVFVFTGQGSHYAGMGSVLYDTCDSFRESVNLCVSICEEHQFSSFLDIITNKDIDMSTKDTMQTQLAVVTLEVGLAVFWRSCGVEPSLVMGHSLGEYVALHVSGVLSLADMLYLVGHRARMFLERCEAGACAMLAISTSADAVRGFLDTAPQSSCSIACTNSPVATVVSGSTDDVAELQKSLTSRSVPLSIPYGFHSFQMDTMLEDYISLAGGVTYSTPKIPVASTLTASIVDADGVFDRLYLGRQTREPVDFVGALNEVKKKLADPVWLEIGPSPVCSSFIRATISLSPGKIVSSLQTNTDPWASISECLVGFYQNGMAIDWLALHSPFASGLKLLTMPSYAWDLKDYWITYTEKNQKEKTLAPAHGPTVQISTCAQYVVQESTSPELAVTLGASMASPAFNALIDGHRIRGVSIVPGSVFCDAGLAAAKYALQYDRRTDAADSMLIITDVNLTRPLNRSLVGSGGELLTTATTRSLSSDRIRISWKASSTQGQYNLGTCVVAVVQKDEIQTNWQRISYFVNARMNELISTVKGGHGHRMLPDILYALFSNTVEYDPAFKCIQEAFISSNFEEAVAEVILRNDPEGTQFAASPYWGETLVHLAGFLVNSNPSRLPTKTTFMMDSFGSFEQTATFAPGKAYFTYVRVSNREKDTTSCDVYVFDAETLVMQCSGLRFHEVSNDMLDRLLGKGTVKPQIQEVSTKVSIPSTEKPVEALEHIKKASETRVLTEIAVEERKPTSNTGVFEIVLESIAKATGTKLSELTDDMELAELGESATIDYQICTD